MFGEEIKEIRLSKNMRKAELARRSNVSPCYIGALEENKKRNPSSEVLKKIAAGLDVNYEALLQLRNMYLCNLQNDSFKMKRVLDMLSNNKTENNQTVDPPEESVSLLLESESIKNYFNTNLMSDSERDDLVTAILNQIKLATFNYKK